MLQRSLEPTEHSYQLAILEHLALRYSKDVYVWRQNSGALPTKSGRLVRFGKAGASDILGLWIRGEHTGKIIALEVKRPSTRNNTSSAQKSFLETVSSAGGFAGVVVSPKDVDELLRRQ